MKKERLKNGYDLEISDFGQIQSLKIFQDKGKFPL